ncbi:MAG: hypothetical protein RKE49_14160 [Oceanicaulis sp.]
MISGLIAASILSVFASQAANGLAPIAECQSRLTDCAAGECQAQEIEAECDFAALSQTDIAIIRAEVRNAAARLVEDPAGGRACRAFFRAAFENAANRVQSDGLMLSYGVEDPLVSLDGVARELVLRAELEVRLTEAAFPAMNEERRACPLSPPLAVTYMRAQNLAFAERNNLLARAEFDPAFAGLRVPVFLIYLHADLWQQRQGAALEVFQRLSANGLYGEAATENLFQRVAAQQPLYRPEDLEGGWAPSPAPN